MAPAPAAHKGTWRRTLCVAARVARTRPLRLIRASNYRARERRARVNRPSRLLFSPPAASLAAKAARARLELRLTAGSRNGRRAKNRRHLQAIKRQSWALQLHLQVARARERVLHKLQVGAAVGPQNSICQNRIELN